MNFKTLALGAALALTTVTGANAVTATWATLTNASAGVVGGNIGSVGVTFNGSYSFAQLGNAGIDYWALGTYTQGNINRPVGTDIIALDQGGVKSITFSQAVTNPYVAFNSWNGNTVSFSSPFTIISQGCGYWGCGTFVPFGGNTGFTGSGETVGVLQFIGTFTSLTFTDTSENWHGITIGLGPQGGAPEPAAWAMMLVGFGLLGSGLRRRSAIARA